MGRDVADDQVFSRLIEGIAHVCKEAARENEPFRIIDERKSLHLDICGSDTRFIDRNLVETLDIKVHGATFRNDYGARLNLIDGVE